MTDMTPMRALKMLVLRAKSDRFHASFEKFHSREQAVKMTEEILREEAVVAEALKELETRRKKDDEIKTLNS